MKDNSAFLTLDPGRDGVAVLWINKMPWRWVFFKGEEHHGSLITSLVNTAEIRPTVAVIERTFDQTFRRNKGAATLIRSEGALIGAANALMIPSIPAHPSKWKAFIKRVCRPELDYPDEDATAKQIKKGLYTNYAHRIFPAINMYRTARTTTMHDGLAEALCIGVWFMNSVDMSSIAPIEDKLGRLRAY